MTLRQFLDTVCRAAGLIWRYDDYAIILALPVTPVPLPAANAAADAKNIKKGAAAPAGKDKSSDALGNKIFDRFDQK